MKVATHHYKQQMLLLIIIFMHVSIKVNRKSSNSSMEEIRQCRLNWWFLFKNNLPLYLQCWLSRFSSWDIIIVRLTCTCSNCKQKVHLLTPKMIILLLLFTVLNREYIFTIHIRLIIAKLISVKIHLKKHGIYNISIRK